MNDLRDQLTDSAHSFDVGHRSPDALYDRARRRHRRSLAARALAVVLILGAGSYAVDRLATTRRDVVVSDDQPNDGQSVGSSTAPASATPGQLGADDDPFASLPQTRPAEFVATDYEWKAYRADSPEALAMRFDPKDKYAISTGPETLEQRSLYRNDGGTWDPIVDLGNAQEYALSPDAAYVVLQDDRFAPTGTMRIVDLPSGTAREVAFPAAGGFATTPTGRVKIHPSVHLSVRGAVVAALIDGWVEIDQAAPLLPDGWSIGEVTNGVVHAARATCDDSGPNDATTTTLTSDQAGGGAAPDQPIVSVARELPVPTITTPQAGTTESSGTMPPLDRRPTGSESACFAEFSVDELGLTDGERDLIDVAHPSLWTFDGSEWHPVDVPEPDGFYQLVDHAVLAHVIDPASLRNSDRYFAITDQHNLQPLFDGHALQGWSAWPTGKMDDDAGVFTAFSGQYIFTQQIGSAEWHATDLGPLGLGAANGPIRADVGAASSLPGGGVAARGGLTIVQPVEPMDLTSDDGEYRLSFAIEPGVWTVSAVATGETVEAGGLSTEPGRIAVSKPDPVGSNSAFDDPLAIFSVDWTSVPGLQFRSRDALFVSSDGVRYRTIDVRAALRASGMPENQEYVSLEPSSIQDRGDQVVLHTDLADGTGDSTPYVFVGTQR